MYSNNIQPGCDAKVISGPHEGRAGRVLQTRDVSIDGRESEPYAILEYAERNVFKEVYVDQISVPVRRLERTR